MNTVQGKQSFACGHHGRKSRFPNQTNRSCWKTLKEFYCLQSERFLPARPGKLAIGICCGEEEILYRRRISFLTSVAGDDTLKTPGTSSAVNNTEPHDKTTSISLFAVPIEWQNLHYETVCPWSTKSDRGTQTNWGSISLGNVPTCVGMRCICYDKVLHCRKCFLPWKLTWKSRINVAQ